MTTFFMNSDTSQFRCKKCREMKFGYQAKNSVAGYCNGSLEIQKTRIASSMPVGCQSLQILIEPSRLVLIAFIPLHLLKFDSIYIYFYNNRIISSCVSRTLPQHCVKLLNAIYFLYIEIEALPIAPDTVTLC